MKYKYKDPREMGFKKVKISKLDSPEKLAQKILKEENKIYPKALDKIFSSFWRKNLFLF